MSDHAGVDRRVFLAGPLAAVSWVVLSAARPIMGQQIPASAGPGAPDLIDDLITANRILAREGVVDAFGHVSVRHNLNPNRFFLSRSLAPALVTPDDLIEYDLDSNAVNAKGRPEYSERFIHGEIYKARPDIGAVVHAHGRLSTTSGSCAKDATTEELSIVRSGLARWPSCRKRSGTRCHSVMCSSSRVAQVSGLSS